MNRWIYILGGVVLVFLVGWGVVLGNANYRALLLDMLSPNTTKFVPLGEGIVKRTTYKVTSWDTEDSLLTMNEWTSGEERTIEVIAGEQRVILVSKKGGEVQLTNALNENYETAFCAGDAVVVEYGKDPATNLEIVKNINNYGPRNCETNENN